MPQTWTKTSYPFGGSGAAKLADSQVAPLVAAARGYYRVHDREGTKALAARATSSSVKPMALQRSLNLLVADEEDIMVMPWFALSQVAQEGTAARSYNTQYRPSRPLRDEAGKTRKYAWFPGERLVLDVHPSTPTEWLTEAYDVMLTEGLLKGDSALSALLLDSGVTADELAEVPESMQEARLALNALMLRVPKGRRMPIVNSASVTTWEDQNDQWRHIRLTDRRFIVAFDGDLHSNTMVYRQTVKAMRFARDLKAKPEILSMFSADVELAKLSAGIDPDEKLGIDDYLSKVGDWGSLLSLATPNLPPEPQASEGVAVVGQWRVHPENAARVQEYAQEQNADGSRKPARWVDRYRIGGRVVSTIAKRRPTRAEMSSGQFDVSQEMLLEDSDCEIEIALLEMHQDFDQEPSLHRVIGPATMLSMNPADWTKHARMIPNEVLNHPEWPPRKGADWLGAVKGHRREHTEQVVAWKTMGWVPVPDSTPAFIVGSQVLGRTERDEEVTQAGVTEHILSGASSFGLVDTFRDMTSDEYRAQVAADIRQLLRAYIENGFWKSRLQAVCVVAAMLRPTIPLYPAITLFFVGPRRSGKTYSASFILTGWEQTPGTWNEKNLNGQASDTVASTEHAVSIAPIWVQDDLAPQADRRKAEQQESDVSQLIRNVANGSAKRRMDARMQQREVANPNAVLIITAENPPSVSSIQDRLINVRVQSGAFDDAEDHRAERELKDAIAHGVAARLNAAMVRFWMHDDTGMGTTWAQRQKTLREMLQDEHDVAREELQAQYGIGYGEASRHAWNIASLGLSFQVLQALATWAGIPDEDPLMQRFGSGDDTYMADLYALAADSIMKSRKTAPGRALIESLARLLASGKAHLRNPTTPGAPPFTVRADDAGGTDVGAQNEGVGWEYDSRGATWVPRGTAVGYLGVDADGERVALFDMQTAFQEAKRFYPTLIPHGQTAAASWESIWGEGFGALSHRPAPGSSTQRIRLAAHAEGKTTRLRGIPVSYKALTEIDGDGDDDTDD